MILTSRSPHNVAVIEFGVMGLGKLTRFLPDQVHTVHAAKRCSKILESASSSLQFYMMMLGPRDINNGFNLCYD